jgi:hypothetical protein
MSNITQAMLAFHLIVLVNMVLANCILWAIVKWENRHD